MVIAARALPSPLPAGWLILLLVVTGTGAALLWWSTRKDHKTSHLIGWARPAELKQLQPGPGRITLGFIGRRPVAVDGSALILGPPNLYKINGIVAPALVEHQGPAIISATIHSELEALCGRQRRAQGRILTFAPAQAGSARWSPIGECRTWQGAMQMAIAMLPKITDEPYPPPAGGTAYLVLAALFYMAANEGFNLAHLSSVVNRRAFDEAASILTAAGHDLPAEALRAALSTNPDTFDAAVALLQATLMVFSDEYVAAATTSSDWSWASFCQSSDTLFLQIRPNEATRLAPLLRALMHSFLSHIYTDHGAALLLCVDETAQLPLEDLDQLAANGWRYGVQLLTLYTDLSAIGTAWGSDRAKSVFFGHRHKLVMAGVDDLATLDIVSQYLGERDVPTLTRSHTRVGSQFAGPNRGLYGEMMGTARRRVATVDDLRLLAPGEAILLAGSIRPSRITVRVLRPGAELEKRRWVDGIRSWSGNS